MSFILSVYVVFIIVAFICTLIDEAYDDMPFTPKEIFDTTNLNMFGSCVFWLFVVLIDPILFIFKFIGWIFTVGRKK
jgi:hypothetical protein